jgi:hypothetical protein
MAGLFVCRRTDGIHFHTRNFSTRHTYNRFFRSQIYLEGKLNGRAAVIIIRKVKTSRY